LCRYTLSPRDPNHRELGSWGLGWTCGILFGQQCCVTLVRSFIGFGIPGEGSRGHEAPHHAVVLEFMPDEIGVVWASLLKEPLEVVCGQPCRALATVHGGRDAPHARVACFLAALLLESGIIRWCLLIAAWGRLHACLS
jgi:hypothetical protein